MEQSEEQLNQVGTDFDTITMEQTQRRRRRTKSIHLITPVGVPISWETTPDEKVTNHGEIT
jgi:hypothetical protein